MDNKSASIDPKPDLDEGLSLVACFIALVVAVGAKWLVSVTVGDVLGWVAFVVAIFGTGLAVAVAFDKS